MVGEEDLAGLFQPGLALALARDLAASVVEHILWGCDLDLDRMQHIGPLVVDCPPMALPLIEDSSCPPKCLLPIFVPTRRRCDMTEGRGDVRRRSLSSKTDRAVRVSRVDEDGWFTGSFARPLKSDLAGERRRDRARFEQHAAWKGAGESDLLARNTLKQQLVLRSNAVFNPALWMCLRSVQFTESCVLESESRLR